MGTHRGTLLLVKRDRDWPLTLSSSDTEVTWGNALIFDIGSEKEDQAIPGHALDLFGK